MKKIYLSLMLSMGALVGFGQVIITEIADPNDNALARFVELYNLGSSPVDLSTWKINRYTNAATTPQTAKPLTGTINPGDFYIIAASTSDFNAAYGFDPDQDIGTAGPADSNGDDIIFLLNTADEVVDIFGTPGIDGSGTCGEFEDGRAERKETVLMGSSTFTESEWNVFADSPVTGCASHTNASKNAVDMDPGSWIGQPATTNPEPTNHVASFTATVAGAAQIDLTWTANNGVQPAEGYLLLASTGTITAPTDFTEVMTDADLSDGSAALSLNSVIESYSFTSLSPFTTYNFEIYTYSNSGETIDYKTDGTVPSQSVTTDQSLFSPGDIIISEIMFNSIDNDEEWIELYNNSGESITLTSDWNLKNSNPSLDYSFDGTLVIADQSYVTLQIGTSGAFPFTPDLVIGTSGNKLVNSASEITLLAEGVTIDEVAYSDSAIPSTDGAGPSLALAQLSLDNSDMTNWVASAVDGGTPGVSNDVTIWTGSSDNELGSAGNWSNGAPSSALSLFIPSTSSVMPNVTLDVEAGALRLGDGISLVVQSGSLKVIGDIVNDGSFSVTSGASLVLMSGFEGSGSTTVSKNTTFSDTDGQYSIIGSPIEEGTTSDLGTIVYSYNEEVAYGQDGSARFSLVTESEAITPGDAYFSANTGSISFIGTPNTGTVSKSLIYNSEIDGEAAGFNLVSNPYTAAIDIDALVAGNADISASIYLWQDENSAVEQGSNSDYVVYNSTDDISTRTTVGGRNFDGFARSTQGFFVKAAAASAVTFTSQMMDAGNNSDAGYYRASASKKDIVRFSLTSNDLYSDILVSLRENATTGVDRLYDAYQLANGDISLYSLIGEDKFAIQGLPGISSEITIDLGFDAKVAGSLTLKIEEGQFDGYFVYLLDNELETMINLSETNAYTFSASEVVDSKRFQLVLKSASVLGFDNITKSGLNIFSNSNGLNVQTEKAFDSATISIYSIGGSEILKAKNVDLSNKAWSTSFTNKGLFIMTIETENGLLTKKFLN